MALSLALGAISWNGGGGKYFPQIPRRVILGIRCTKCERDAPLANMETFPSAQCPQLLEKERTDSHPLLFSCLLPLPTREKRSARPSCSGGHLEWERLWFCTLSWWEETGYPLSHLVLAAHCTATLGSTEQTPEPGQRTAWGVFELLHLGWCLPVPALCLASPADYLPISSKAAILQ